MLTRLHHSILGTALLAHATGDVQISMLIPENYGYDSASCCNGHVTVPPSACCRQRFDSMVQEQVHAHLAMTDASRALCWLDTVHHASLTRLSQAGWHLGKEASLTWQ